MKTNKKVILVVLDGWGIALPSQGNMVAQAYTPCFDFLKKEYSYTQLCASGECVGLPVDQPGNSEAGHLNLGAGRIIKSDDVVINEAIADGTFFKNPAFLEGIRQAKERQSKIHLIGLVTEQNSAHSDPDHWLAMLKLLDRKGVSKVYLHLFTDGRDSSQHAALKIIERFERKIDGNHHNSLKVEIGDVCGRFYAMDRKRNWQNIKKAYDLLVYGQGLKVSNVKEAIINGYNRQETDEYISPTVIVNKAGQPRARIAENDVVFFMNLRSDRARELTKAFVQTDFVKKNPGAFSREKIKNLFFVTLTDFGPDLDHTRTAFPSRDVRNSLPIWLDGIKQYYIAETEKYAHVTFFFNGGYDHPVAGETREIIPSPNVDHYDLTPEMSAFKITERLIQVISTDKPNFILANFCNPDMLGHTGNKEAAKKGIEIVDQCLDRVVKIATKEEYILLVTADHGNAEEMLNPKTGEIETTHTTNPVPFIIVSKKRYKLSKKGVLGNIAPTILDLMALPRPKEMLNSLIYKSFRLWRL